MALDLVLRAQTPGTLAYALKRPMMQHLGIRFPRVRGQDEILDPDNWHAGEWRLGPDVFYHYIRRNDLVVTHNPVVTDPACWLRLRIIRAAFDADHEDDPNQDTDPQPDRWRQSKSKRKLKEAGTQVDWNGVRAWQHKFPNSAPRDIKRKTIQIIRGSELAGLDIFPQFGGGGYF